MGRSELCDDTKNGCEGDYFHFGAPSCRLKAVDYSIIFDVQCKVVCNLMYAIYLDVFFPWMFLQN